MPTILYPVNELKIGGAEQELLELVRGLDKTRYRPIVAPLYTGGALDAEFRAIAGVEVIDLNRRGKYDPRPLWRMARLLRGRRVEIVQPFLTPATFFGLLPALLVRTKATIVTERCGVRQSRGAGYALYRSVEDKLSRFAGAIVPNSYAGQDLLVKRGLPASKIRVIYNGVNESRLHTNPLNIANHRERLRASQDSTVIGILASLTSAKGHDTLLRAVVLVRDKHTDVRLAIIGDGPNRAELETLAETLELSASTVFFGYQRNVADLLAACDILVSASRDNEGCSNSILEAMALGIPVIATDVGGSRELVQDGETGLLTPVGDHQAMAAAVIRMIEDCPEAAACAARARDMIFARFTLQRMVHDYEELYQRLLGVTQSSIVDPDGRAVLVQDGGARADRGSS